MVHPLLASKKTITFEHVSVEISVHHKNSKDNGLLRQLNELSRVIKSLHGLRSLKARVYLTGSKT